VNAERTRPLLAFWALALVAGVITTLGLREGSTRVEVPAGVPSPVVGSRSAELVLGGILRAQPSATSTQGFLSDAWTSASALEYALGLSSARTAGQPTSHAVVAAPKVGVPTDASAVASARASATPSHPGGGSHGHATSTATATAKPTHPPHGKGHGPGHGAGKGNAPTSTPGNGKH
jgi:hypothetical protein